MTARRRTNKSRAVTSTTGTAGVDPIGTDMRDHMARVHVDDQTWAAFKRAAGAVPISEVLGQLVTKHVEREAARRVRDGSVEDWHLLDALAQARELRADVAAIVLRLDQRLARDGTAAAGGRIPLQICRWCAPAPFTGIIG